MALHPHNIEDLLLAPVALAVDARIEELAALSPSDRDYRIALEANVDTSVPEQRRQGFVHAVTALIEMHGWEAALSDRGVRLSHGDFAVVLGLPDDLRAYLAE